MMWILRWADTAQAARDMVAQRQMTDRRWRQIRLPAQRHEPPAGNLAEPCAVTRKRPVHGLRAVLGPAGEDAAAQAAAGTLRFDGFHRVDDRQKQADGNPLSGPVFRIGA